MTSFAHSAEPAQRAAQSRLAVERAEHRLEQTRRHVTASEQSCAESRQAVLHPHLHPVPQPTSSGSAPAADASPATRTRVRRPFEQAPASPAAPLPTGAWPELDAR